jgi:phosphatidylglycerophosphate synthase
MPTAPFDRRPIATRETRIARMMAGFLARNGASPNGISIAGLIAGLLAGVALVLTNETEGWARRACWLTAGLLVQLRLLANMLDGMVAIASGRSSRIGELFNEFPDRLSDAAALIGLGYVVGGHPELGYVTALAAVLTAYVRALGKTAGAPNVFAGPMAKPHRMALVTLTAIACAVLPNDWLDSARIPTWALAICLAGTVVTIGRRLVIITSLLRGQSP